jgi:putative Ca2+/H+ antiporter (TMEM165/GDT1 family)
VKLDSVPNNLIGSPQPQIQPGFNPQPLSANSSAVATTQGSSSGVSGGSHKSESVFVTFGTTFVTIFLAEIGDKTQLSTLLMSAQSHQPWVVFLGSAAALITTSFLGVALGSWISTKLSPKTVEKSAGVMLLLVSVMLFWDVIKN